MYIVFSGKNRVLPVYVIFLIAFTCQKLKSQKMIPPVESYKTIVSSNYGYRRHPLMEYLKSLMVLTFLYLRELLYYLIITELY